MEEWILDDLLECSVCLERLDTSSKVLPCQHTFCKKCLEEISRTHSELRCPECRILVETAIDDLPPNVLLMRILEGIRNVAPEHPASKQPPTGRPADSHPSSNARSPHAEKPNNSNKLYSQPCAKAIYDYSSHEPGDLSFKKGDIIHLRKKVDVNWYKGDIKGRVGVFPANYVQILEPLQSQVPQCKALYDFKMANDEEEGCLAFNKGEIITVIRRVDENWAEGKLNNKIGIFPIAFVDLNSVARALMKLSIEAQPGPSRVAPPTPTTKEDPFPIPSVVHQTAGSTSALTIFSTAVSSNIPTSDSSSNSLTSPSSTSNTTTPTTSSTSSHTSPSSPSHAIAVSPTFGPIKRHSFGSTLPNGSKSSTKRHSAEILTNQDGSGEPHSLPVDMASSQCHSIPALERTGSQRLKRIPDGIPPVPGPQIQHSSLQLPALYVALYPYKPGNDDELELKRGAIYTVTERCQDGWFKGQHFRSQKGGVFPGNYVAPAKSLPALQAQVRGLCRSKPSGSPSTPRNGTPPLEPRNTISYMKTQPIPCHKEARSVPPVVLPPTATAEHLSTTVVPPPNVSVPSASSKSTEKSKDKKEKGGGLMRRLTSMKKSKSPPPTPYSMDNPVFEDSTVTVAPPVHVRSGSCPNQLISSSSAENRLFSPTSSHRAKMKERPSLSRISPRMTSEARHVQHRKSSSMDTPSTDAPDPSHSMSTQPTFLDDQKATPYPLATPFLNVPDLSKSSQSKVALVHEKSGEGSVMKPEVLQRQKPSHDEMFSQIPSRHQRSSNDPAKPSKRSILSPDPAPGQDGKSQSKGLPLPRERFRCVVPYPPNSEYELELQLGDVIYVHKKRDDGWYKGTQQRTGRTGLFPASFVQSF